MPAPRLLDKKLVNASLATERKQEIDKGIKLVKSIEALQEERGKEENKLEEFRVNTLKSIQIQIDAKVSENDRLALENKRIKEERLLAQAPINLKEEWQRVREESSAITSWTDRLTQQSIELLAREEDSRTFSEKLEKEDKRIQEERVLSQRFLEESESKFLQSDQALERAEREAQETLQNAQQRENHVKVREEEATLREVSLSKREREVDVHEIDLANREQKLKSRQELFIKAQAYIKSKKKV